jgi:hypothetical protein
MELYNPVPYDLPCTALAKAAGGIDLSEEHARARVRGMTFDQVFTKFRKTREGLLISCAP